MPRTPVAITNLGIGGYPNALTVATPAAADVANKNMAPITGQEIFVFLNTGAAATVTITSVAENNRTGDIAAFAVPAAAGAVPGVAVLPPLKLSGWQQKAADAGQLYFEASAATVYVVVLRSAQIVGL